MEAFVAEADLAEHDLLALKLARLEFAPKAGRVKMRLPAGLLDAVKAKAAHHGLPYQRYIRQALEEAVQAL